MTIPRASVNKAMTMNRYNTGFERGVLVVGAGIVINVS